jgi:hypothetical protein
MGSTRSTGVSRAGSRPALTSARRSSSVEESGSCIGAFGSKTASDCHRGHAVGPKRVIPRHTTLPKLRRPGLKSHLLVVFDRHHGQYLVTRYRLDGIGVERVVELVNGTGAGGQFGSRRLHRARMAA